MRRAQPFLWILCLCSAIATPAMADDMEFEERIRKLEQKLRDIEQEHRQPQGTASPATEGAESSPTSGGTALPDIGKDLRRPKQAPLSFSTGGSGTMIYAKPFVSARRPLSVATLTSNIETIEKMSSTMAPDHPEATPASVRRIALSINSDSSRLFTPTSRSM
jgi:hypothetical protein